MYSSSAFQNWRSALDKAKKDVGLIFDKGVKEGSISKAGWTHEKFQRLLDWKHSRIHDGFKHRCGNCNYNIYDLSIQPLWVYSLEEIKRGVYPEEPALASYKKWEAEAGITFDMDSTSVMSEEDGEEINEWCEAPYLDGETKRNESFWFEPNEDIISSLRNDFLQHSKDGSGLVFETSALNRKVNGSTSTKQFSLADSRPSPWLSKWNVVCMACWLDFLDIDLRDPGREEMEFDAEHDESGSTTDVSSDDDFSPFLIHS